MVEKENDDMLYKIFGLLRFSGLADKYALQAALLAMQQAAWLSQPLIYIATDSRAHDGLRLLEKGENTRTYEAKFLVVNDRKTFHKARVIVYKNLDAEGPSWKKVHVFLTHAGGSQMEVNFRIAAEDVNTKYHLPPLRLTHVYTP